MNNKSIEIPRAIFEKMFFQDGGQMDEKYRDLTGQYIHALPEQVEDMSNAEIETNEYVATDDTVKKAVGDTHEDGGMDVALNDGDKILSDYKKVGGELAQKLSKEYDIKVKATDTYAKALDKYLKKIGHTEATEEMESYVKKLDEQKLKVEDETTLALNSEVLMAEINEYGNKLGELEKPKQDMFNLLFFAQEATKEKETETDKKQDGGTINDLMSKYNISKERFQEMFQDGGQWYSQNQPMFSMLPGAQSQYPDYNALQKWIGEQDYKAEYPLGDVEQTALRFKDLADNAGVKYTDADFKDINSLNNLAGRIQKEVITNKPELAKHYGFNVEPTRQGLQYLVDKGYINPADYAIPMSGGKVARGSYDTLTTENERKLRGAIDALPYAVKGEYSVTNFNDNLAYFRGIKSKEQELSDTEYEAFIDKNKGKEVGAGYYQTDVPGVYVKPTKKGEAKAPATTPSPSETVLPPAEGALPPKAEDIEVQRKGLMLFPERMLQNPTFYAPMKFTPTIYGGERVEVSPNQALSEINRQQTATQNQIMQLPDAQRAATLASMDANAVMATSKAVSDAEKYNAQARERESYENAEVKTKQSLADAQSAAQYQQLMGRELEGFENKLAAINNIRFADQTSKWMAINQLNRQNALNSDVVFTGEGYEVAPYQLNPNFNTIPPTTKPKKKSGGRFKK